MNIVVLGGAGFIGSHLVDALIKDKHNVFVVDDYSTGSQNNVGHHFSSIYYSAAKTDLSKPNKRCFVNKDIDVVFNLAAVSRVGQQDYNTFANNYIITLNAINMALSSEAKLIHFSSCAAGEGYYLNSYSWSKAHGEDLIEFYTNNHGLNSCVISPYNVYGDRCPFTGPASNAVSKFLHQYNSDQPFTVYGDGECVRDYIHVSDVVSAAVLSMYSVNQSRYLLGTGIGTSVNDLIALIDPSGSHPISRLDARNESSCLVHENYMSSARPEGWKVTKNLSDFIQEKTKKGLTN